MENGGALPLPGDEDFGISAVERASARKLATVGLTGVPAPAVLAAA